MPLITVIISGGPQAASLESLLLDALLSAGATDFETSVSRVTGNDVQTCRHFDSDIQILTSQGRGA